MFGIKDLPVAPPFIMLVLSDDVHQETTRDSEDQGGLIHIDRDDFSSPRRQRPAHLLSPEARALVIVSILLVCAKGP